MIRLLLRYLLRLAVPSLRSVRLALYALVVFGGLALGAARSVRADVAEVGFGLGHQLAKLEDLTGGAYTVRINSAEVHWASARTEQSVDQVMDRFEIYCRESPSTLGRAMQHVPLALEGRVPIAKADPVRVGVVREGAGDRGMVACFVDDEPASGSDGLARKLEAFGQSGDLSKLGRFRYVFAERRSRNTKVVTIWADGPLELGKMFPTAGDAPGTDSTLVPRPGGSRRTLTATVDRFPAAVRIYEAMTPPADVLRDLDAALVPKGFERVARGEGGSSVAAWVRQDGAEVIASTSRIDGPTARTSVSIVESSGTIAKIKVERE